MPTSEQGNGTENRQPTTTKVRVAGFPELKYLQELVREELPKDAQTALPELETLEFIKEGRNIIFCGNPGTGKTHDDTFLTNFVGCPKLAEGGIFESYLNDSLLNVLLDTVLQDGLRRAQFLTFELLILNSFPILAKDLLLV